MTLPSLVTAAGKPVPLDRQLAAGGEGAVYTLRNDPARLAKVYHQPRGKEDVQKLMAIVGLANPKLMKVAAWPTELLCDARTSAVVGFAMNRMNDCQSIQHLYNPVQRLKYFPQAGWNFQIRAAANLAAAFDELHAAGCLVGDVNQGNALVSTHKDTQAMVRLIDCDSFQIQAGGKQYLCKVGVAHYTPPELQGKSFDRVARTENHDRFGLAVLIYQLLFAGRHPYMGLHGDDATFEQLIAKFRFSQGPAARSWGMQPPPHTPTFDDIPPEMGGLFRRSFEPGSDRNARPRPSEWLTALGQLEKQISPCKADSGHKYWSGTKVCTWCRLAQKGGPEYYFGAGVGASSFAVDEAKLQEVLQRLSVVQCVVYPWDHSRYASSIRPMALPLPSELMKLRADWKAAEQGLQIRTRDRQAVEAQEVQNANVIERRRIAQIEAEFQKHDVELEDEYAAEYESAKAEDHDQGVLTGVLVATIGMGIVLLFFGFYHKAFAAIGIMVTLIFGAWLGIYLAVSPAAAVRRRMARIRRTRDVLKRESHQQIQEVKEDTTRAVYAARELTNETCLQHERAVVESERVYRRKLQEETSHRKRGFDEAEAVMRSLEQEWTDRGLKYKQRHQEAASSIQHLVTGCRGLMSSYQTEINRLIASAEATSRLRHMRLHLIADAEIPKIGDGRKQTLASYNIYTAADIEEHKVRDIKGFGDSLTNTLLAWQNEVRQRFVFDPKTGVSPTEQQAVTNHFRANQQRMLAEINQRLSIFDSLAPSYHGELQRLTPNLQTAAQNREQAKINFLFVSEVDRSL